MKAFYLLLVFFPIAAFSGIKPGNRSLDQIKDELGMKARQADAMAASIKSLEKEIGKVNNKYLERSKRNQSLEQKLNHLQANLEKRLDDLKYKEKKAKKLVHLYALESHDQDDENSLLKKTILSNLLKKRLGEIKKLKSEALELKSNFEFYQASLKETRDSEESLYSLVVDLENKKKDLSQAYVSSLESKNELEEKLESAIAKRNAYSAIAKVEKSTSELKLIPPLEKFVNFRGSEKGVTFKYDTRAPVKASAGGKVVYAGELASYGKVVMIDHGAEVRSVILGDIQIKVKKGDQVAQGQLVGYTMAEPGLKKSLYYEVRKKNVAQNTLRWLENERKLANI